MEHNNDHIVHETFGCAACQYQYHNSDHIGQGGFGIVYKATSINRCDVLEVEHVAVKVSHLDKNSELLTNPTKWTKLRQRLQKLPEFRHDNLVTYHKITIAKGSLGGISIELMMDYHTGGDLNDLMYNLRQQKVLLSEVDAVSYMIQIAEGLQFLHAKQIIHGDLKPSNILITQPQNGNRKLAICDLDDIVQMERDGTCSHDITNLRGTCRFMSPEMVKKFVAMQESGSPGRKTDIWSLGCIMLELADCIVGNDKKFLHKRYKKIEVGNKVSNAEFVQLIIEGYVPFAVETIPAHITQHLQRCTCTTSADRISASALIQQLKSREFILIFKYYRRYHRTPSVCCWFDPSTKRMTEFPLPRYQWPTVSLCESPVQNRCLMFQGSNFWGHLDLTRKVPLYKFDTFIWNVQNGTRQRVLFPGSSEEMVCPIAIMDKVYFWSLDIVSDRQVFKMVDLHDNTVSPLSLPSNPKLNRKWKVYGAVQHGNRIIYFGKHKAEEHKPRNKLPMWIRCFDTVTGEWDSLPDLPDRRRKFAMVVLQNAVYVLGGIVLPSYIRTWLHYNRPAGLHLDHTTGLRSCLRLDLQSATPRWQKMRSLLQKRWDHCAFVAYNRIYVIGGGQELSTPSRVLEVYDTERDLWSTVDVTGPESISAIFYDNDFSFFQPITIALDSSLWGVLQQGMSPDST